MIEWQRKKVKVYEIESNQKNPRVITTTEFEKLKDRIERLGFHSCIKVDTNNVILGGNQRFEALKKMGHTEIEVLYPSRELTEKERNEIIITDNTHSGEFDFDLLYNEWDLSELEDYGLDINFDDENDLSALNDMLELNEETYTVSFEFPSSQKDRINKAIKTTTKEAVVDFILEKLGIK